MVYYKILVLCCWGLIVFGSFVPRARDHLLPCGGFLSTFLFLAISDEVGLLNWLKTFLTELLELDSSLDSSSEVIWVSVQSVASIFILILTDYSLFMACKRRPILFTKLCWHNKCMSIYNELYDILYHDLYNLYHENILSYDYHLIESSYHY